jgi:uncharacterized membrane protein YciS (DUF1049 family)
MNLSCKFFRTFFTIFSIVLSGNPLFANGDLDSLMVALEKTMTQRDVYDSNKELRIQNLKDLLEDTGLPLENKYYVINKIIDEYEYYSFDFALLYIEQNIEISENLDNSYFIKESKLRLAKLLAESGRYKEAIDALNELNRKDIPDELLDNYYYGLKEGYSGLSYYTTVKKGKRIYSELYELYQDSLSKRLMPNVEEFLRLSEKTLRDNRELDDALAVNDKRLESLKMGTRLYSLVTFERSLLYELKSDVDMQKKYLVLSAMSDIMASVKDNASMSVLALLLFQENEIERAHNYINFSVEDAEFYNSKLRYVNISNVLSVITKAYEERSESQKSKLTTFLILISLLGGILFIALIFIYRQVKRLATARNKLKQVNNQLNELNTKLSYTNDDLKRLYNELSDSDRIKEHYIGTFLNLYSDYINKLDIYRKVVIKHLIRNQTSDLLELTKSKQVIDDEIKLFYKNFDESFLHIYPNFVQDINALLKPNEQIHLKNEEQLNTELRIFALIRLGITNSAKISKILRYSVNTIYNYRVKVKNSALVNREDFENLVKNIP